MFEKEAEEYGHEHCCDSCKNLQTRYKQVFKDGAEFGYNKAKEEGKVVVEHFEAYGQCRDSRRIAGLEKENAELKEQNNKAEAIIKELSKSLFLAKGIVRDLIDDTVDFKESKERAIYCYEQGKFDTYKEAGQFLKESENERK